MRQPATIKKSPQTRAAWKNPMLAQAKTELIITLVSMVKSFLAQLSWQPTSQIDIDLFSLYCREHGVGGILGVLEGVSKQCDTLYQFGTEQYFSNLIKHERMRENLLPVADICRREGIKYCIVKGPALSDFVYQDGGIRSYGDIDILVSHKGNVDTILNNQYFNNKNTLVNYHSRSLKHPGRVHVNCADNLGETIEFFYPIADICDPIFDFIWHHSSEMLNNGPPAEYETPPITLHFIFLLLHLQKHLGARLLWHLDILIFYLKFGGQLDFDLIRHELQRLQLTQISTYLAEFYLKHFNIELNISFNRSKKGWNSDISRKIASVEQLHGNATVNRIRQYPLATGILAATRFFVITDPENQGPFANSKGASWLASLLQIKLGVRNSLIRRTLTRLMLFAKPLLVPVVRYSILKLYRINTSK